MIEMMISRWSGLLWMFLAIAVLVAGIILDDADFVSVIVLFFVGFSYMSNILHNQREILKAIEGSTKSEE